MSLFFFNIYVFLSSGSRDSSIGDKIAMVLKRITLSIHDINTSIIIAALSSLLLETSAFKLFNDIGISSNKQISTESIHQNMGAPLPIHTVSNDSLPLLNFLHNIDRNRGSSNSYHNKDYKVNVTSILQKNLNQTKKEIAKVQSVVDKNRNKLKICLYCVSGKNNIYEISKQAYYKRIRRSFHISYRSNNPSHKLTYRHKLPARLTRENESLREKDIAAIFKGVAYGMPTESALMQKPFDGITPIHLIEQPEVIPADITTTENEIPPKINFNDKITFPIINTLSERTRASEKLIKENWYTKQYEIGYGSGVTYNPSDIGFPTTISLLIPPSMESSHQYPDENVTTETSSLLQNFKEIKDFMKSTQDKVAVTEYSTSEINDGTIALTTGNAVEVRNNKSDTDIGFSTNIPYLTDDFNTTYTLWQYNISAIYENFLYYLYSLDEVEMYIRENIDSIWNIYVYCTTTLYGLIAFVSLQRLMCQCNSLPFFLHFSFYLVMFASSFVRALIVLWNPYKVERIVPELMLRVLYIAAEPCVGVVMSSFIVLLLNIFFGMIALPVIIAFFSAAEMATGLFAELALQYFAFRIGDFSQNFLETFSFIVGMTWNGIICFTYIVILSNRKFRRPLGRQVTSKVRQSEDNKLGNDDLLQQVSNKGYQISGYCYVVTFAQLCMIGISLYTLLHSKEIVARPNTLKKNWVLVQIVSRFFEFIVYSFLLAAASKVYRLHLQVMKTNQANCCICYFNENDLELYRPHNGNFPIDIYTLNYECDEANHCPADDFQLVWNRNSSKRESRQTQNEQEFEGAHFVKKSEKNDVAKRKKRKTVRERNMQFYNVEHNTLISHTDKNQTYSAKTAYALTNSEKTRRPKQHNTVEKVDIHATKYKKVVNTGSYTRIKRRELTLEIQKPKEPSCNCQSVIAKVTSNTHNISAKDIDESSHIYKEQNKLVTNTKNESKCENYNQRKIPRQFWSPQHTTSRTFTSLPPLPMKSIAPLDLPSLPPLNAKQPFVSHLSSQKFNKVPGKSVPETCANPMSESFKAAHCLYTPSREFVKDFTSCRTSPFSERLSSADLATISSFSEMRVDYLTDLSSTDGHSLGSLSYFRASRFSVNNISDHINYY